MIDLTDARGLFVDLLMPDTCTISTPTTTSDGGGASAPGTPTTTTSVGRLWTRAGRLDLRARRAVGRPRGTYGLALPVAVAVSPLARIIVGGRTFRIVYQPPVVGLSFEQELGLEEVR